MPWGKSSFFKWPKLNKPSGHLVTLNSCVCVGHLVLVNADCILHSLPSIDCNDFVSRKSPHIIMLQEGHPQGLL